MIFYNYFQLYQKEIIHVVLNKELQFDAYIIPPLFTAEIRLCGTPNILQKNNMYKSGAPNSVKFGGGGVAEG